MIRKVIIILILALVLVTLGVGKSMRDYYLLVNDAFSVSEDVELSVFRIKNDQEKEYPVSATVNIYPDSVISCFWNTRWINNDSVENEVWDAFDKSKGPTLISLHFLLCMDAAHGQTEKKYFVSKAGNDSNPGTKKKPFKTIDRVNQLILKPGDAVYFKGGGIFNGTLAISLIGNASKKIEVSSYGNGRAELNGGENQSMVLRGAYFRLSNINAKGAGRKEGNTTPGVQLIEASNAEVENVIVDGFQKAGLDLYDCKNTTIKKVKAYHNGFSGIYVKGSSKKESANILLKDCLAENNPGDPSNVDNHNGNGILVGFSTNVTIEHCVATNNGWDMPRVGNGPVGIWTYESDSITIQYCIAYRNRTQKGAKDGGGFDLDGGVTNSVIQYCLSYENEGAGYGLYQYAGANLWYNNIVRYCISINDAVSTEGAGGIFMWNNSGDSVQLADCMVYNNLVYSTHAPAVMFEPHSPNKNFQFVNNIFIGKNKIIDGPSSGEKFSGNIWWSAGGELQFREYASLEEWAQATGQEKVDGKIAGKHINPQLKGPLITTLTDPYQLHSLTGYQLKSSTPIRSKGLNLKAIFNIQSASRDFYNNPVPNGPGPEPGVHELK